jgi:hypothetical protein
MLAEAAAEAACVVKVAAATAGAIEFLFCDLLVSAAGIFFCSKPSSTILRRFKDGDDDTLSVVTLSSSRDNAGGGGEEELGFVIAGGSDLMGLFRVRAIFDMVL